MSSGATPSQTVGPFFHGLVRDNLNVLVKRDTKGEHIRIEGVVYDGSGAPVPDAMVEVWQANAHGRYRHAADRRQAPLDPSFTGFGRAGTDDSGRYWFETVKPGAVPAGDAADQAPHINVAVFARGLLDHLFTRIYFADETANRSDPVLRRVPEARRGTLIAQRTSADGKISYRFDIILQGEGETVFFDI